MEHPHDKLCQPGTLELQDLTWPLQDFPLFITLSKHSTHKGRFSQSFLDKNHVQRKQETQVKVIGWLYPVSLLKINHNIVSCTHI